MVGDRPLVAGYGDSVAAEAVLPSCARARTAGGGSVVMAVPILRTHPVSAARTALYPDYVEIALGDLSGR